MSRLSKNVGKSRLSNQKTVEQQLQDAMPTEEELKQFAASKPAEEAAPPPEVGLTSMEVLSHGFLMAIDVQPQKINRGILSKMALIQVTPQIHIVPEK